MRQPRTSEMQHMQAPVSEPVRLPPGRRETCRRPRRGHTRMPQRVVSAGRGARSEADFTPRTVAGSAEAAGGGLSGGGELCSPPLEEAAGEMGPGQAHFGCRHSHCEGPGVSINFVFLCSRKTRHCRWTRGRSGGKGLSGGRGQTLWGRRTWCSPRSAGSPWRVLTRGIRNRF